MVKKSNYHVETILSVKDQQTSKAFARIAKQAERLRKSMSMVKASMGVVAGGFVAKQLIDSAAIMDRIITNFDKSLMLEGNERKKAEDFNFLKDSVLDMNAALEDSLKMMLTLSRSGFGNLRQSIPAASGIIKLLDIIGSENKESDSLAFIKIIGNLLGQEGKTDPEKLNRFFSLAAESFMAGTMTAEDFKYTVNESSVAGKAMGLDRYFALISMLSLTGQVGSTAGTAINALNNRLLELDDKSVGSANLRATLENLGIKTRDEDGKTKDPFEMQKEIFAFINRKGLDDQGSHQLLKLIFGDTGLNTIKNFMKESPEKIDKFMEDLLVAAQGRGFEDMSEYFSNQLPSQFTQLTNRFKVLGADLLQEGGPLSDSMKSLIGTLREGMDKLLADESLSKLINEIDSFISKLADSLSDESLVNGFKAMISFLEKLKDMIVSFVDTGSKVIDTGSTVAQTGTILSGGQGSTEFFLAQALKLYGSLFGENSDAQAESPNLDEQMLNEMRQINNNTTPGTANYMNTNNIIVGG